MTDTEQALLSLLRCALVGTPPVWSPDVNFAAVGQEALQQAVLPLAYEALSPYLSALPPKTTVQWRTLSLRKLATATRLSATRQKLVTLLNEAHIPYRILKGDAAAAYYPSPSLRVGGDIDFLVQPDDCEAVTRLLTDAGYTVISNSHPHHVGFVRDKVHLEMHFRLPGLPQTGPLADCTGTLFTRQRLCRDQAGSFAAPDPVDHGLLLLLHMQRHMLGEGLGLRHLCDWGCFVNATAAEPFWEDTLLPLLRQAGLLYYAQVLTALCAAHLGTVLPAWAAAPDAVQEAVLEDILRSGNFGRKDPTYSASRRLIAHSSRGGTVRGALRALHANAGDRPAVKRHPWLHPAADVAYGGRYLFLSLTGRRPALHRLWSPAVRRKALYRELHLFDPSFENDLYK